MNLRKYLFAPTTVAGIATLCGTAEAVLTGHLTWQAAVPLVVGALVGVIVPDNSSLTKDAEALATAAVQTAIDAHNAAAHAPDDGK